MSSKFYQRLLITWKSFKIKFTIFWATSDFIKFKEEHFSINFLIFNLLKLIGNSCLVFFQNTTSLREHTQFQVLFNFREHSSSLTALGVVQHLQEAFLSRMRLRVDPSGLGVYPGSTRDFASPDASFSICTLLNPPHSHPHPHPPLSFFLIFIFLCSITYIARRSACRGTSSCQHLALMPRSLLPRIQHPHPSSATFHFPSFACRPCRCYILSASLRQVSSLMSWFMSTRLRACSPVVPFLAVVTCRRTLAHTARPAKPLDPSSQPTCIHRNQLSNSSSCCIAVVWKCTHGAMYSSAIDNAKSALACLLSIYEQNGLDTSQANLWYWSLP